MQQVFHVPFFSKCPVCTVFPFGTRRIDAGQKPKGLIHIFTYTPTFTESQLDGLPLYPNHSTVPKTSV